MGYKITIKKGDEILKESETETMHVRDVRKILDDYAESVGKKPEELDKDIIVDVVADENTVSEQFGNVYKGFTEVNAEGVLAALRSHLGRLAIVSDLMGVSITMLSKSEGIKGTSIIFDETFDKEAASMLCNGLKGHSEELTAAMDKQFGIVEQDDSPIIIPGA